MLMDLEPLSYLVAPQPTRLRPEHVAMGLTEFVPTLTKQQLIRRNVKPKQNQRSLSH